MAKPKSAKLLCTPNVFERCFLNQGHLAQVPVRLYIRKVGAEGGAEVSATISNPAYNANAEIPQQGTGRRTNKKIKGTLKSIAKAGKVASLATLAAGQPEIAAPLGAVAEAPLQCAPHGGLHMVPRPRVEFPFKRRGIRTESHP